ncbi:DUF3560 domain-containing protein [Streptomyces sp. DH12]|uniref:DUF3560 domain-containing protein n=1 Tax=Streptomyces sp. DH12 TaxID=2857010 RepID=UPI001E6465F4|nr:DUF3560 domain-containing protein [Streptomyces sp. DH12]
MAHIAIRHTRAAGTTIDGSERGDGVLPLLRPLGFRNAYSTGVIYLRGSRDRAADTSRIRGAQAALEAAGHTVTLDIQETVRRPFEEAEVERYEQAGRRAVRLDAKADRLQESSDEKWLRARQIGASYQGEPVKVDHYSSGRHLRDLERAHTLSGQSVAEQEEADRCRARAAAAARFEQGRKDPGATLRRLDRLRADRRRVERQMDRVVRTATDCAEAGNPIDPHVIVDHLVILDADHLDLCDEISRWERHIESVQAKGVKIWSQDDFTAGDYARTGDRWYLVLRVNKRSLTVPRSADWRARVYNRDNQLANRTSTLPYDKVTGRMSAEEMADRLQADAVTE